MPGVDSTHIMWRRLFPDLFHSASGMPCLILRRHQLSAPSSKPKGGRPPVQQGLVPSTACATHGTCQTEVEARAGEPFTQKLLHIIFQRGHDGNCNFKLLSQEGAAVTVICFRLSCLSFQPFLAARRFTFTSTLTFTYIYISISLLTLFSSLFFLLSSFCSFSLHLHSHLSFSFSFSFFFSFSSLIFPSPPFHILFFSPLCFCVACSVLCCVVLRCCVVLCCWEEVRRVCVCCGVVCVVCGTLKTRVCRFVTPPCVQSKRLVFFMWTCCHYTERVEPRPPVVKPAIRLCCTGQKTTRDGSQMFTVNKQKREQWHQILVSSN